MAYKDFGIALLLKQSNANYSLVTEFNILFMHILHISEYYISVYKTTFFPVHLHAYKQKPTPICNNGIASTRLALWLKWGRHAWGTALFFSRGVGTREHGWLPGRSRSCRCWCRVCVWCAAGGGGWLLRLFPPALPRRPFFRLLRRRTATARGRETPEESALLARAKIRRTCYWTLVNTLKITLRHSTIMTKVKEALIKNKLISKYIKVSKVQ